MCYSCREKHYIPIYESPEMINLSVMLLIYKQFGGIKYTVNLMT